MSRIEWINEATRYFVEAGYAQVEAWYMASLLLDELDGNTEIDPKQAVKEKLEK